MIVQCHDKRLQLEVQVGHGQFRVPRYSNQRLTLRTLALVVASQQTLLFFFLIHLYSSL